MLALWYAITCVLIFLWSALTMSHVVKDQVNQHLQRINQEDKEEEQDIEKQIEEELKEKPDYLTMEREPGKG